MLLDEKFQKRKKIRKGWFKWVEETIEREIASTHTAGEIAAPYEDLVIDAYYINTVSYLVEIAARLQKELGKPVKVRLTSIGSVPLAVEGQVLSLLAANNHDDTAETLIQMVAKRLESNTQVQVNLDQSIDLWTGGDERPTRLLTVAIEHSDDDGVHLRVTVHRSGITETIKEEIVGLDESLHYKGKRLSYVIEEMY